MRAFLPKNLFWPDENSVTTVSKEKVLSSEERDVLAIGQTVGVKIAKKVYSGCIVAIGKKRVH